VVKKGEKKKFLFLFQKKGKKGERVLFSLELPICEQKCQQEGRGVLIRSEQGERKKRRGGVVLELPSIQKRKKNLDN